MQPVEEGGTIDAPIEEQAAAAYYGYTYYGHTYYDYTC